jgi:hypothetical protein
VSAWHPAWTSHNFGLLRFPMVVEGFLASGRILGRSPEGRRWLGQASRSCSIDARSDASEMLVRPQLFPIARGEPICYLSKIYRRLASRSVSGRRRLAPAPADAGGVSLIRLIASSQSLSFGAGWIAMASPSGVVGAGGFEWVPGPGLDPVLLSVVGDLEVRTPEDPSAGFREPLTDMAPPPSLCTSVC